MSGFTIKMTQQLSQPQTESPEDEDKPAEPTCKTNTISEVNTGSGGGMAIRTTTCNMDYF